LRPGFTPCDLALEILLARENLLQCQANSVRLFSAVYQKRRRTFAAGYL
jgi:hypothetical protein